MSECNGEVNLEDAFSLDNGRNSSSSEVEKLLETFPTDNNDDGVTAKLVWNLFKHSLDELKERHRVELKLLQKQIVDKNKVLAETEDNLAVNVAKLEDSRSKTKSLEALLAAKDEQLEFAKEALEKSNSALEEKNQLLADALQKQECQRCEDSAKVKELEKLLKTNDQLFDKKVELLRADNFSIKEEVGELRSFLDKRNCLTLSKNPIYFFGKVGNSIEFMLKNVSGHRVAFFIRPPNTLMTVSPADGILGAGDERKISLRCECNFGSCELGVFSVRVPDGGGDRFHWVWFVESSDVSSVTISCVF